MSLADRGGEGVARRSVDRLALALEDAGFDVGREFPALHDAIGRQGVAVVRLGDIQPAVADRLAAVVTGRATGQDDEPEEDATSK